MPQTDEDRESSSPAASIPFTPVEGTGTIWARVLQAYSYTAPLRLLLAVAAVAVLVQFLSQCNSQALRLYWENPGLLVSGTLVVLSMATVLHMLLSSFRVSLLVCWPLLMLLAMVNAAKLRVIQNPLTPSDLFLTRQGADVCSADMWPLGGWAMVWTALACLVLAAMIWLLVPRGKSRLRYRALGALLGITFIGYCIVPGSYLRLAREEGGNGTIGRDPRVAGENFGGFLIDFLGKANHLVTTPMSPPYGYGRRAVTAALQETERHFVAGEDTTNRDVPRPVNLLVVVNESFWDITKIPGLELSGDPLATYHRLCREHVSFDIVSPVVGGNTCDAEWEMLTGGNTVWLPQTEHPFLRPLGRWPALPSHLRSRGWGTLAIHPGRREFWNRNVSYPALGFDEYVSSTEMTTYRPEELRISGLSDAATYRETILRLSRLRSPYFCYTLTIQNHTPSASPQFPGYDEAERPVTVLGPRKDPNQHRELQNYVDALAMSDQALAELVRYLEQDTWPTLLVFVGDHQPYLKHNSDWLVEGFPDKWLAMHTVEVLVWANFPLRESNVARQLHGMPALPCYILRQMGEDLPPMLQAGENFHRAYPLYGRRGMLGADGNSISPREIIRRGIPEQAVYRNYRMLQYDLFFGRQYALPPSEEERVARTDSIDVDPMKCSKLPTICHAGGEIDGLHDTNSIEAVELNYKKGFRHLHAHDQHARPH